MIKVRYIISFTLMFVLLFCFYTWYCVSSYVKDRTYDPDYQVYDSIRVGQIYYNKKEQTFFKVIGLCTSRFTMSLDYGFNNYRGIIKYLSNNKKGVLSLLNPPSIKYSTERWKDPKGIYLFSPNGAYNSRDTNKLELISDAPYPLRLKYTWGGLDSIIDYASFYDKEIGNFYLYKNHWLLQEKNLKNINELQFEDVLTNKSLTEVNVKYSFIKRGKVKRGRSYGKKGKGYGKKSYLNNSSVLVFDKNKVKKVLTLSLSKKGYYDDFIIEGNKIKMMPILPNSGKLIYGYGAIYFNKNTGDMGYSFKKQKIVPSNEADLQFNKFDTHFPSIGFNYLKDKKMRAGLFLKTDRSFSFWSSPYNPKGEDGPGHFVRFGWHNFKLLDGRYGRLNIEVYNKDYIIFSWILQEEVGNNFLQYPEIDIADRYQKFSKLKSHILSQFRY